MSKENVLKKEFQPKDVERLRNILKGKAGEKTTQSIGYEISKEEHKDGDIWIENGKKWTIKDGIKQNITKLDLAKKYGVPLFCPSCNNIMNKQLDSHYFSSFGCCMECNMKKETELKLNGDWESHNKEIHNKEIDIMIENYKAYMEDALNESNNSFIAENGDVERWVGGINKERALNSLEEGILYLKSLKR
jgi:hypothetical protein